MVESEVRTAGAWLWLVDLKINMSHHSPDDPSQGLELSGVWSVVVPHWPVG